MSKIEVDEISPLSGVNTDLTISGKGTGVPNLATGFKVGGVVGVTDLQTGFKVGGTTGVPLTSIRGAGTSGQVLTSTGASSAPTMQSAAAGGGGFQSCQWFYSSATWTKPAGITKVIVYITGGGGGGGYYWGGGGGGGGTAIKKIDVTSIASVTVTIGIGGVLVSSQQATAGGSSSFGSHCSATGGTGGGPHGHVQQSYPGVGGKGNNGDIDLAGGSGETGSNDPNGGDHGGSGGCTYWGGGIQGKHQHSSANNSAATFRVAGAGEGGYIGGSPYGRGYGLCVVEEYE